MKTFYTLLYTVLMYIWLFGYLTSADVLHAPGIVKKSEIKTYTTDEGGIKFPAVTKIESLEETDKMYRQMQSSNLWQSFITNALMDEFSNDICMISPIDLKKHGQIMNYHHIGKLKDDIETCAQGNATFIFAPLGIGTEKTAHATLLFYNKSSKQLERYDPNGAQTYQNHLGQNFLDNVILKSESQLTTVPKIHFGFPVQLMQSKFGGMNLKVFAKYTYIGT